MSSYKVESGLQLLARLTKKPDLNNFFPQLFGDDGPQHNSVIELYGENNSGKSLFLIDFVCRVLLPVTFGGKEAGVVILRTDGNLNFELLLAIVKNYITLQSSKFGLQEQDVDRILKEILENVFVLDIYDSLQLNVSIHSLDNILSENPKISMVIIDTLTAYYWSDQGLKLCKMDTYLKNILKTVQKVTRDHKSVIVYSRPEYFVSKQDFHELLEPCCKDPTPERINYRIELSLNQSNGQVARQQATIYSYNKTVTRDFEIINGKISVEA